MSEPTIRPPAPHGASPDGPVGGAEAPFAFDPDLRYAEGIARFLHGSPADRPPLA